VSIEMLLIPTLPMKLLSSNTEDPNLFEGMVTGESYL